MGEKPLPLGEDFSLKFDVGQGFKGSRVQGFKQRLGRSFHLTLGGPLEPLNPKPSALAEGG
jgi:hypothetical protein